MVPKCNGCEHEAITYIKIRKVFCCNHPRAQVRIGGKARPRKMLTADHNKTSPPWCPRRRDMKDRGSGK